MSSQLDTYLNQVKYENRPRVKDDVLLLSSNMTSMKPEVLTLIHNDGCDSRLVALTGTLPIYFQGQQYNIPVDLFIPEKYPNECPKAYVRPTATMIVHPNHRNVDREGLVFLPYLNEWHSTTSNLLELMGVMSSVFSVEPPLFTKPRDSSVVPPALVQQQQQVNARPIVVPGASNSAYVYGGTGAGTGTGTGSGAAVAAQAAWATPQVAQSQSTATTTAAAYGAYPGSGSAHMGGSASRPFNSSTAASGYGTTPGSSSGANQYHIPTAAYAGAVYGSTPALSHQQQQQQQPLRGRPAAGAESVLASAYIIPPPPAVSGSSSARSGSNGSASNHGPPSSSSSSSLSTLNRKEQLVAEVTELLQTKLREYYSRLRDDIDEEFETQAKLEQSKIDVATNLEQLLVTKTKLEVAVRETEEKSGGLTDWGADMETKTGGTAVDPEELLQPVDSLSKQIVALHANQLAIDDAIYYLERALASSRNSSIDTSTFLREIRNLAREQFLCKSHLMKINAIMDQKIATGAAVV